MSKIKIAIIGCGSIATNAHMSNYQLLTDRFEVVAACDIVPGRAEEFARKFGIPSAYEDYHDVLALDGLDAVDICTPNYLHSIIAVEALQKGLHVLCEKPDAINPKEAMKMKLASEQAGKTLMVIRNNRFMNHSVYLKKYIEDGGLGKIYAARCGWQRRRGIPGKGGWFTTKEKSGGGPLIDLGVHMIDVSIWLMGNPRPVAVSGATYREFADTYVPMGHGSRDCDPNGTFDVEDLAMGFIRFDNGAVLQLEFSWASNVERDDRFFELRGNRAGASWHSADDKLKIFGEACGKPIDIIPNFGKQQLNGHKGNLENFADVLEGKADPVFLPEQGVDMIKILSAIYESAESGKEILL
ncbi:MAG: Gfo/Idh/MocA family oxidoreductase [Ruminococcaceae bacterium]|nr:Gfo/Idh/MocA family oxidoreductase [Oscillospiraceae bacterium]